MARQILPVVVFASDVDALKKALGERLSSTDIGVQACPNLPDATRGEWGTFYVAAKQWTQSSTGILAGAADMNHGQSYEDELYAWQQRLSTGGCSVPVFDPNPAAPNGLDMFANIAKWGGVAIVACAGAYVVGRVTEVAVEAMKLAPRQR